MSWKEKERSSCWFTIAAISFAILMVLGFLDQEKNPHDIPTAILAIIFCVFVIFVWSLFGGISWMGAEDRFRKFLGLDSNFRISSDPETMDYLRPLATEAIDRIFKKILALKNEATKKTSDEFEAIRPLIRNERKVYEEQRKLVRSFGFEVRSERKRIKSLQKQE